MFPPQEPHVYCTSCNLYNLSILSFEDNTKKPVNGEVDTSTPKSGNSPLLKDDTSGKVGTNTPQDAASEGANVKDADGKGFDINQFFVSETILPFSGGVSSIKMLIY